MSLAQGLAVEGFAVDVVQGGREGPHQGPEHPYNLIVLDIMLLGMHAYRVCHALRAADDNTPILMLTAKDGEYDEGEGLDTGGATAMLTVGDPSVDPSTRRVTRGGHEVEPTAKEFAVLEMASVVVIPTEYDSRRPGLESQSRKAWVPPPESVRISVCRPRRRRWGSWARASWAVSMWSLAVLEPGLPGRSRAATGSPDPVWPWSTNATSG